MESGPDEEAVEEGNCTTWASGGWDIWSDQLAKQNNCI